MFIFYLPLHLYQFNQQVFYNLHLDLDKSGHSDQCQNYSQSQAYLCQSCFYSDPIVSNICRARKCVTGQSHIGYIYFLGRSLYSLAIWLILLYINGQAFFGGQKTLGLGAQSTQCQGISSVCPSSWYMVQVFMDIAPPFSC